MDENKFEENLMTTEEKTGRKPGRKPKDNQLEKELDIIKQCIAKMAHYSGQERVLDEFGIERWAPGRNDMRKYSD